MLTKAAIGKFFFDVSSPSQSSATVKTQTPPSLEPIKLPRNSVEDRKLELQKASARITGRALPGLEQTRGPSPIRTQELEEVARLRTVAFSAVTLEEGQKALQKLSQFVGSAKTHVGRAEALNALRKK